MKKEKRQKDINGRGNEWEKAREMLRKKKRDMPWRKEQEHIMF